MLPAGTKIRSLGETVIVAWNGAREALRAVHDALPILKRARTVTVFAFSSRPEHPARIGASPDGASWPAWRRHESRRLDQRQRPVAGVEALLACAEDRCADLIVAGAFGHSRLYEEIFGGVSVELLRQQSAPILMSH